MIDIKEVSGNRGIREFINMAWDIYRNDPNWVPPLRFDLGNTLKGKGNPLFKDGSHALYLAMNGSKVVGRILVGIDAKLNRAKNNREGYISLFESINSREVAFALFDRAANWLRVRGIEVMKGPISPTNGDDYRGLLVEGFDGPPTMMNSYNPPYYQAFFEEYGFIKHMDLYAFYVDVTSYNSDVLTNYREKIVYEQDFHIDMINLWRINREMADIKKIIDEAMPADWPDMVPPSLEELKKIGRRLFLIAEKEGILIARAGDRPVGFIIVLRDLNPVFKLMNGNLFPWGIFKILRFRRKPKGVRFMVLFAVPDFQRKAVTVSLFLKLLEMNSRYGITYLDGSTVGEDNVAAVRSFEALGGRRYRTFRLYKKEL